METVRIDRATAQRVQALLGHHLTSQGQPANAFVSYNDLTEAIDKAVAFQPQWKRHPDGSYTAKVDDRDYLWAVIRKGNRNRNEFKTKWYAWVRRFENGQVYRLSLVIGYSTVQAAKVAAESEMAQWQS